MYVCTFDGLAYVGVHTYGRDHNPGALDLGGPDRGSHLPPSSVPARCALRSRRVPGQDVAIEQRTSQVRRHILAYQPGMARSRYSTKAVHDSIAIYHLRVGFAWLSAGGWSGFMSHTFLVRYVIVAYRPGMPRSRCVPGEYAS